MLNKWIGDLNSNNQNIDTDHHKQPKQRRKYANIKKTFVSVENAEEEKRKNAQVMNERVKNMNVIKTLKIDTPWTTGSSDEGSNNYMYYKIQQAKKSKLADSKYDRIHKYLDDVKIIQIDFHGMLSENIYGKDNNVLFKKAQAMSSENQISSKPSSLLMRRKLKISG